MDCMTCDRPIGWHARRAEYLEQTEGPRAVLEFEGDHPEAPAWRKRLTARDETSRVIGND